MTCDLLRRGRAGVFRYGGNDKAMSVMGCCVKVRQVGFAPPLSVFIATGQACSGRAGYIRCGDI